MKQRERFQAQRHRLEMQGYEGFRDEELTGFGNWTRFAPTLCTIGVAVGTALGSAPIIWTFGVTALLGAALPYHPIDLVYNRFVSPALGSTRLPQQGLPRRFACFVATFWLLATGLAFNAGSLLTGIILGGAFVAVAAIPALTGFCVPSWLWRFAERTIQNRKLSRHMVASMRRNS